MKGGVYRMLTYDDGNKKRQFGYINLQKQEKAHRYHIDMPSETMTAKRNN